MNLYDFLRDVPDFPKPGIIFKDISPLLANHQALRTAIDRMADRLTRKIEKSTLSDALDEEGLLRGQTDLGDEKFEVLSLALSANAVVATVQYQRKYRAQGQHFVVGLDHLQHCGDRIAQGVDRRGANVAVEIQHEKAGGFVALAELFCLALLLVLDLAPLGARLALAGEDG